MQKLVTVMISTTVSVEADTDQEARDLVLNDPETKAMVGERLSRSVFEVTDVQDGDD